MGPLGITILLALISAGTDDAGYRWTQAAFRKGHRGRSCGVLMIWPCRETPVRRSAAELEGRQRRCKTDAALRWDGYRRSQGTVGTECPPEAATGRVQSLTRNGTLAEQYNDALSNITESYKPSAPTSPTPDSPGATPAQSTAGSTRRDTTTASSSGTAAIGTTTTQRSALSANPPCVCRAKQQSGTSATTLSTNSPMCGLRRTSGGITLMTPLDGGRRSNASQPTAASSNTSAIVGWNSPHREYNR